MFKPRCYLTALAAGASLLTLANVSMAATRPVSTSSPNIVLILADDLGFSDLGAFGGEIATPNLDALARSGLRLTNFHAAPACSPTRSMLLSGTDNHTAGVGAMAEATTDAVRARYGYEGRITDRVATVAERLQAAGYATIMAGKWHLGMRADSVPSARGFAQSFALLQGAHNHFGKGGFGPEASGVAGATYLDDGKVAEIPDDFYSSDYFTTQLLKKIDSADRRQPFLAYLAFSAPHSPLQAPKDLIEKYRGRYDAGWAVLRQQRLARMQELHLIPADIVPHELVPDAQAWEKLSADERKLESRKMEVYAAMVERLDWNVGRLMEHLQREGRDKNTVVVFISDNGPAGETAETFQMIPGVVDYIHSFDNSLANMGSASSFIFYGKYWAQAASAPFRLHKAFMFEGGTRVPAFITFANLKRQARLSDVYANVMDIAPTLLDLALAPVSDQVEGRQVAPMRGRTMLPFLAGRVDFVHAADEPIALELHGQREVTEGQWKLVYIPAPLGSGKWELYDLANDPAERIDVGDRYPEQRQKLMAAWDAYAVSAQIAAP